MFESYGKKGAPVSSLANGADSAFESEVRAWRRAFAALILAFIVSIPEASAQANKNRPDPNVLLKRVRLGTVLQDYDLEGQLIKRGKKHPFRLAMPEQTIRFTFPNPPFQDIQLDLRENSYTLLEVVKGKVVRVDPKKYGNSLRGTDITYEDLALRFLYWPTAVNLGEEKLKYGKAWKLRITNPGNEGPYQTVLVWIDQKNFALMKLEGYDKLGGKLKEFDVSKVQKLDGIWFLQQMRMIAYNPRGAGKAPFFKPKEIGRSYFEILKSTKKKK